MRHPARINSRPRRRSLANPWPDMTRYRPVMAICLYGSYGNYGNYASCGQTKQTAGLCRFCGIFRMAGETPRFAQCGNRSQPRQPRSIGLAPARRFGGPKAQISPPSDRRPAVWRDTSAPVAVTRLAAWTFWSTTCEISNFWAPVPIPLGSRPRAQHCVLLCERRGPATVTRLVV